MTILVISIGAILYVFSIYFIGIPLAKANLKTASDIKENHNKVYDYPNLRNLFFFPVRTLLDVDFPNGSAFEDWVNMIIEVHDDLLGDSGWQNSMPNTYIMLYAILWPVMVTINILTLVSVCWLILTFWILCFVSAILLIIIVVIPTYIGKFIKNKLFARLKV